jgi:hypothetical protein
MISRDGVFSTTSATGQNSVTSDKVRYAVIFLTFFSFSFICSDFLFSVYSFHEIKYTYDSKQENSGTCFSNSGYGVHGGMLSSSLDLEQN